MFYHSGECICMYPCCSHLCCVYPSVICGDGSRRENGSPPDIFSPWDKTEGDQRPLSTQRGLCHFPFTHKHTHTKCKDKAEAAMVQRASFTLHLLWSTEKTQTIVCVTQYGPLSISSASFPPSQCPSLPLLCTSCLSYITIVHQYS